MSGIRRLFRKHSIRSPLDLGELPLGFVVVSLCSYLCSRACVGRNLASMELQIIISSILRRYDFVLEQPDKLVSIASGSLQSAV